VQPRLAQLRGPRLAVLIVFLASSLTACGGGGGNGGGSAPTPLAPVITTQPAAATVTDGTAATFSVVATGSNLAYRWRRNGSALNDGAGVNGSSSSSLTIEAEYPSSGQQFSVVVTNSGGNVESASAQLTVTALPPVIGTQPVDTTVTAGQSASFAIVLGAGTQPIMYQWKRNGVAIPSANNAAYTAPPTTLLDSGALYSVDVTNPAGTFESTAAVLVVDPIQRTWSSAEQVSGVWGSVGVQDGVGSPRVAIDNVGTGTALWRHLIFNGAEWRYSVAASRREASVWQPRVRLDQGNQNVEQPPQIAMSPNGHTIAIFAQPNGVVPPRHEIYASRFSNGVWATPRAIAGPSTNVPEDAHIVVRPNGDAIAVWRRLEGALTRIFSNQSAVDDSWPIGPILIDGVTNSSTPRIAAGPNGHVVAAWTQLIAGRNRPYFAQHSSQSWSAPSPVPRASDGVLTQGHQIAVNSRGDALIAFMASDAIAGTVIEASRFDAASGAWTAPQRISRPEITSYFPRVAADHRGGFVVAWADMRRGAALVKFDPESLTWSQPELLQSGFEYPASDVDVGCDAVGNAIVSYSQPTSSGNAGDLRVKHCPLRGTCSTFTVLNAQPGGFVKIQGGHQLAVNAHGQAAIAWWEGLLNSTSAVWVRTFD
jgi:Immunoglobulin I-set domain